MTQIEMGYRFASDFLEFVETEHADRTVLDKRANGGRCVVLSGVAVPGAFPEPAALFVYVCEDAQAWGTFSAHETVEAALVHARETLATLAASSTEDHSECEAFYCNTHGESFAVSECRGVQTRNWGSACNYHGVHTHVICPACDPTYPSGCDPDDINVVPHDTLCDGSHRIECRA